MKFQTKLFMALFLMGFVQNAMAVSQADCMQEQKMYLQAAIDDQIKPASRASLPADYISKEEESVKSFVLGEAKVNDSISWHISDTRNINNAHDAETVIQSLIPYMQKEQAELDSFQTRPYQYMADNRFYPTAYQKSVARYRMKICFFEARKRELSTGGDGTQSIAKMTQSSSDMESQCSSDAVGSVNSKLQEIDQRIALFLDSSAGQQIGTATPSLQVVMWGTSQQANVIKQYCAQSPSFKERSAELNASFSAAKDACLKIQSKPEICVPIAPGDIIMSYEKGLQEAMNSSSAESNATLKQPEKLADICEPSGSATGFLACETGRCRESGGVPVKTTGGCLVCGNEEGSLGEGFRWRSCHASSGGVSAAR
jgi:hypothetical protein